jgi:hypothetical protein
MHNFTDAQENNQIPSRTRRESPVNHVGFSDWGGKLGSSVLRPGARVLLVLRLVLRSVATTQSSERLLRRVERRMNFA